MFSSRFFLLPCVVLLATLSPVATAGMLTTDTYVEATVTTPSGLLPYAAQFDTNPGFLGSDSESLLASGELTGTWFDHDQDWQGWLGSYYVDLFAAARADYGDLGVHVRNHTFTGSWLGPVIDGNSRAYATASFEDLFRVEDADAEWAVFTFVLQGTMEPHGAPPLSPLVEVNGSPEYFDANNTLAVWVPVQPDGNVQLDVLFGMDATCSTLNSGTSACGVEADYFNSMRLIGAEVICSSCETPPGPRLFTLNRYSGISTIVWVPEPSTIWLVAFPLALLAFRRRARK